MLYAWSTTCGCVPTLHEGLSDLEARFGEAQGVAWIAIDGEPKDRAEAIRARQTEVGSRYRVLLDPTHRLCQVLGFDRAAVIAVLDGDGYLRWWGNPTDRLYEPTRHDLAEALPALLAGEPVPASQREPTYGCAFSGALEDCP